MQRTVIKYGLISGLISSVMMVITSLLTDRIGADKSEIIGYIALIACFLFVYFGMVSFRDNEGNGKVSYGKALVIGLLITAISSVCYVITWVIIYHTMFPDFMEKYSAQVLANMKAKGASATEISKKTTEMQQYTRMYKNPVMMCLITFMEPLPVGIIISFISALIVQIRRKPAGV
jgi:hypothetical protein